MVKFARRDLWTICEPLVQNPQCGRLDVRILNLPCQCANSWTCAILHLVLMLLFELYDIGGLLAVICHPDAWGGLSCSKKDLPQQRRRPKWQQMSALGLSCLHGHGLVRTTWKQSGRTTGVDWYMKPPELVDRCLAAQRFKCKGKCWLFLQASWSHRT